MRCTNPLTPGPKRWPCRAAVSGPCFQLGTPTAWACTGTDGAGAGASTLAELAGEDIALDGTPGLLQMFGDTYGTVSNRWNGQLCGVFVPGGSTPVTFFSGTIQPIFNTNCTGCHVGATPPAGMSRAASVSYGQIVNVTSTQSASGMKRIIPSSTTNSYLYRKVTNTHLGSPANGSGSSMPPGGTLSGTDVSNLATWINGGANP